MSCSYINPDETYHIYSNGTLVYSANNNIVSLAVGIYDYFCNFSEKFEKPIEHEIEMLIAAYQVPEVLLGKGNIPEGLAKVQMDAFERMITSIQVEIEKVIENKIFTRILEPSGLSIDVEFECENVIYL